jgi:GGDEF domain-containing protein
LTANLGFASQYHEKDEAVPFLSYFDSLTGLAKRPLFCQRLNQHLHADSAGYGYAVVVFDVQKLANWRRYFTLRGLHSMLSGGQEKRAAKLL